MKSEKYISTFLISSRIQFLKIYALKKYLYTLLLLIFSQIAMAQTQGVAYPAVGKGVATTFVTDYHCLGINTSTLGWGSGYEGKKFTLGTSEFGFGIYSDSLSSDKLRNLLKLLRQQASGKDTSKVDWQRQQEAAAEYAEAGIAINVNYNWFGFAYQSAKFGGIAFNVTEQYNYYSKFNKQTTDLIFRGKLSSYFDSLTVVYGQDTSVIANNDNISQDSLDHVIQGFIGVPLNISTITKGSEVKMQWNRYFNFGYGRKIFGNDSTFALYGGVGGRYIQSMAAFSMKSDETGLYFYSSISPSFNINYGMAQESNPSAQPTQPGGFPKIVGTGYGYDLSASMVFFNSLKVAVAVNNIGSVTYNRNVYRVKDTLLGNISVNGISNENINRSINQFLKDGGIFELKGEEKVKVKNAADIRFGASIKTGGILNIGIDIIAPFDSENPGSIQNTIYSIGGEVRPVKWLALSAGYYGGGIYKNNIPVGINFILKNGSYEAGISSTDAISFFSKNGNSISSAFGFARVRF